MILFRILPHYRTPRTVKLDIISFDSILRFSFLAEFIIFHGTCKRTSETTFMLLQDINLCP
jgi:hypothetical protein